MSNNRGIDISEVLFIIFLVLKLVGVITWSWWWVTSPIWIPLIIILIFIIITVVTVGLTK